MKAKSFSTYLEKRLNREEIAEIERAAQLEHKVFKSLQKDIVEALSEYMAREQLGFNELVRRLGKSPTQVSKILQGKSNLTLASIAQIYALMNKVPHLSMKKLKD